MSTLSTLCYLSCCAMTFADAPPQPPDRLITARLKDRVCKTFDFNERILGNYESLPIHWRPILGEGYPRFLEPRLDETVGHDAPPSFRFEVSVGHVGAEYLAPDIHVHPGCDYEISAWIRTRGISNAAAVLSAYYLDHALARLGESRQTSLPVRDAPHGDDWQRVTLRLSGGHARARWIGLACEIVQPESASNGTRRPDEVILHDVYATAWFDDIRVVRLPRVTLDCPRLSRLYSAREPVELNVNVADLHGDDLRATLRIYDADGREHLVRDIPPVTIDATGRPLQIDPLSPGLYHAELDVRAGHSRVHRRTISFAVLAAMTTPTVTKARSSGIGLALQPDGLEQPEWTASLIRSLRPAAIRIPIPLSPSDGISDDTLDALHRLLRSLDDTGIAVIPSIVAPPTPAAWVRKTDRDTSGDTPSAKSDAMLVGLRALLTRHADHLYAIQFDGLNPSGLGAIRRNLGALLNGLMLATSWNGVPQPSADMKSAIDVCVVPYSKGDEPPNVALHAQSPVDSITRRRWIDMPSADGYALSHAARRAFHARQLLDALAAGADFVFTSQPWSIDRTHGTNDPALHDDFVALRTMAHVLSGMKGVGTFWIADGVEARLFVDTESSRGALALWTTGHDASSIRVALGIAPDARAIDLQGVDVSLHEETPQRTIEVTPAPILVSPVDPARIRTMASFHVQPPRLTANIDGTNHTIRLVNHLSWPLRGELLIDVPSGWSVTPRRLRLDLSPGSAYEAVVRLHAPSNQSVGRVIVEARFQPEQTTTTPVRFRAPLEVNSPLVDGRVLTRVEGEQVVILQRLTNRAARNLHLRMTLLGGGLPTQTRLITDLPPGESVVREFVIPVESARKTPHLRLRVEDTAGAVCLNQLVILNSPDADAASSGSVVGIIRPQFTSTSNRPR